MLHKGTTGPADVRCSAGIAIGSPRAWATLDIAPGFSASELLTIGLRCPRVNSARPPPPERLAPTGTMP